MVEFFLFGGDSSNSIWVNALAVVSNCNFKGAVLKFILYDGIKYEIVDWKVIIKNNDFWAKPRFINCTMPDGSKKNDPEP